MQGVNDWDMDTVFIPSPSNPERHLERLGSPHLYYNPSFGDGIIYLSFYASELYSPGVGVGFANSNVSDNDLDDDSVLDNDLDSDGIPDATDPDHDRLTEEQKTCFILWVEKSRFLAGEPWFTATFRPWFPQKYGYKINNTGSWRQDGGYAQAVSSGDSHASIPTTGAVEIVRRYDEIFSLLGDVVRLSKYGATNEGFVWAGVGPRAWMRVDSVVFFDPKDNCRPWVGWSWSQRNGSSYDGGNLAAFPLLGGSHSTAGYRLADAAYQNSNFSGPNNTQPLQLMYAYDPDTLFPGTTIPNGRVIANGNNPAQWVSGGVAEGTEIFTKPSLFNEDWTYVMAARNPWDQPSYQIVYRKSSGSLESMHLPWGGVPTGANESVLLASNWVRRYDGSRDGADRTNFGGAEHFRAYGRDYIIFHKHPNTDNPSGEPRQLFIKELTWDLSSPSTDPGKIIRLYDGFPDGPWGSNRYRDVNWYAAPNVAGLATAPVP